MYGCTYCWSCCNKRLKLLGTCLKETRVKDFGKGITIYKGEHGYLPANFEQRYDCDIIFTVVTRLEVRQLHKAVSRIDDKAFVFTNTIKETADGMLKRHASH